MKPLREDRWHAGQMVECQGGDDHEFNGVHIIAKCACGAAFMSTDATIAVRLATDHAARHNARSEASDG